MHRDPHLAGTLVPGRFHFGQFAGWPRQAQSMLLPTSTRCARPALIATHSVQKRSMIEKPTFTG
ncbi:hypothetical protein DDQ41_05940 [Streptomyces spongiicola]|uniref:Uncharacterized protein n=1 Tax=Streptomyces spongiicola TaxID=1690221 RepID=A0ABM6V363_9ACTN|nr:hypothetical protein DDQ41_05940 [Streptomyces spongiicola]